ncbi:unnamed protein product [Acanthocheilonema viteae]|uniref:Uncharacterized protein n=1 Tax=Acanthocheilonema viteae TaxID=6277 RepID=A0A498SNB4_ACAVI|nr:unnamed protein product [Acanthocheilonema viteae]
MEKFKNLTARTEQSSGNGNEKTDMEITINDGEVGRLWDDGPLMATTSVLYSTATNCNALRDGRLSGFEEHSSLYVTSSFDLLK